LKKTEKNRGFLSKIAKNEKNKRPKKDGERGTLGEERGVPICWQDKTNVGAQKRGGFDEEENF